jgi:hypothetical protein
VTPRVASIASTIKDLDYKKPKVVWEPPNYFIFGETMEVYVDYENKRFVDKDKNPVLYETLPPKTNIVWDGKVIRTTNKKGNWTREWKDIYKHFNMSKNVDKLGGDIYLKYIPKNSYRFEITDSDAKLFVNDKLLDPTTENILDFELPEFVYGVIPTVINAVHPLLFSLYKSGTDPKWNSYSPQIRDKEPAYVFKNGESAVPACVVAFVHLCLSFKKVFNKSDGKLVTEKFGYDSSEKTDTQEYRAYAWKLGLYVLQQTRNEMKNAGYPKGKRGDYVLHSLKDLKPQKIACRDVKLTPDEFSELEERFQNTCPTCKSVKGQPHVNEPTYITTLEQGHIDPLLPLSKTNCIPQCKLCNATYKNRYKMELSDNGKLGVFLNHSYLKSKYSKTALEKYFQDIIIEIYP